MLITTVPPANTTALPLVRAATAMAFCSHR